jgi:hypothetical protein
MSYLLRKEGVSIWTWQEDTLLPVGNVGGSRPQLELPMWAEKRSICTLLPDTKRRIARRVENEIECDGRDSKSELTNIPH